MSYPKKYNLTIGTAVLIAGISTFGWGIISFFFQSFSLIELLVFFGFSLITSFLLLRFRVEKFISEWVKTMYKDMRLLDEKNLTQFAISMDMESLSKEMERFAADRKLQIETLNIREDYRKEYMGNVAHELKTPLFTAQGYILTLLDGAKDDPEILQKYLEGAGNAVERLVKIVHDLDMISQLEAGELRITRTNFDIIALIENVFDLLEMTAENRNITLVFDQPYPATYVHADRDRMEQVLINLLVNSLKYGKPNGTTEVSIEELSPTRYLVRITDNGEGIPERNLHRIFERFYRVDTSGSRKDGGSGLGLAIVKHIVEAHFEKIYIESQLGVGSEFSFTIERSQTFPEG